MKAIGLYALALLAGIMAVGLVAWLVTDAAGQKTVLASGGLAVAVQLAAFATARAMQGKQMLLGWGLGSVMRLGSLVAYAVIVAKFWRASITPALLSYVAMLFVTTAVEPLFLRK